jgi:hypothetical protein
MHCEPVLVLVAEANPGWSYIRAAKNLSKSPPEEPLPAHDRATPDISPNTIAFS